MRLITTLLLICTLSATHVVPLGHTHEVDKLPVDHHARPHVHRHGYEHEHDHSHHDHDHAHVHADGAISSAFALAEHDDDAIYIEFASAFPATAESRTDDVSPPEQIALLAALPASVALSPPNPVAEPPPRIRLDGPPLYLRNLSLRI